MSIGLKLRQNIILREMHAEPNQKPTLSTMRRGQAFPQAHCNTACDIGTPPQSSSVLWQRRWDAELAWFIHDACGKL